MTLPEVVPDPMVERLSLVRVHLDERARRLLLGAEAKVLGLGGIKAVAAACGAYPDPVAQGVRELDYTDPIPGRGSASRCWPTWFGEHGPWGAPTTHMITARPLSWNP